MSLGHLAFGVNYMRQPLAILLMILALAFWAASLGLLIGSLARKEDQVIVLCLIAMFLFAVQVRMTVELTSDWSNCRHA